MFDFSSDPATDLAANRNGVLDPAHKNRLRLQLLQALALPVMMIVIIGALSGFIVPLVLMDFGAEGYWVAVNCLGVPLLLLLVGLLTGQAQRYGAYVLALLELLTGEPGVQFADGDLTWHGRGYQARGEGHPLHLPPNAGWLPGNYRFYLLPRSQVIVNAERIGGAVDTRAEMTRALQSAIGFGPDDIMLNQQGRLGNRQRLSLLGQSALQWLLALVFFGGVLLLPALILAGEIDDFRLENLLGEDLFILITILVFFSFSLVVVVFSLIPVARDVTNQKVLVWEGDVRKRAITTGSGRNRKTTYYYEVNGQRAQVTRLAYDALIPGQRYRVYVASNSKRVVAAEWLGERITP